MRVVRAWRSRRADGGWSDVAPTLGEAWGQVVAGMRAFSILSHPRELVSMLGYALPRHGLSPAAAIVGAGLTWGDAPALVDGRGSVSYRQLGTAAGRLAAGLYRAGIVGPGTRVGLMADDDRYLLTALGAVGLCGGTVWLVNPRLGSDDLAGLLQENDIEVVIHADHCAERVGGFAPANGHSASADGRAASANGHSARSRRIQNHPDHGCCDYAQHDGAGVAQNGGVGVAQGGGVGVAQNDGVGVAQDDGMGFSGCGDMGVSAQGGGMGFAEGDGRRFTFGGDNGFMRSDNGQQLRLGDCPTLLSMSECSRLIAESRSLPVPCHAKESRFVMLTGGTTATPASIPIKTRWSAVLPALALAGATGIRHGDPTLLCAPCFHGYGLAVAVLALVAGSPLILSSACRAEGLSAMNKGGTARLDWGEAIFAVAKRHQVATIIGVPAQLRSLAGYLTSADPPRGANEHQPSATRQSRTIGMATSGWVRVSRRNPLDSGSQPVHTRRLVWKKYGCAGLRGQVEPSPLVPVLPESVRTIVSGADRLDRATIEALQARWGPVVVNYYGTTESGTVTMISGTDLQARPDSLGRPVATSRVRILGRAGRVLQRGQIGRIQAVSPMASLGVGAWAAAYTTADLGWVDQAGYLYLKGRLGAGKAGGEFVDPARVETVLAGLDGVAWARARLVPDEVYGRRVVAEVGLADGAAPDPDHWRAEVRTRLGPPAVPSQITVRVG